MNIERLIYWIIALIVFVTLIFIIVPFFYKQVFPWAKTYDDLPSEVRSQVEMNFNQIVINLNNCSNIKKSSCLCKNVFPNWPAVFQEGFSIKLDQTTETKLTLLYNGNPTPLSAIIKNFFFFARSSGTDQNIIPILSRVDNRQVTSLNFEKKPKFKVLRTGLWVPVFQSEEETFELNSPHVYKCNFALCFFAEEQEYVEGKIGNLRPVPSC